MMEPKRQPLLHLLPLLLLGFTCLLPVGAVRISRSLASSAHQEPPALNIVYQWQGVAGEEPGVEEASVRGRMDLQSFNDYPGSGANNRHDPKTPGRA